MTHLNITQILGIPIAPISNRYLKVMFKILKMEHSPNREFDAHSGVASHDDTRPRVRLVLVLLGSESLSPNSASDT